MQICGSHAYKKSLKKSHLQCKNSSSSSKIVKMTKSVNDDFTSFDFDLYTCAKKTWKLREILLIAQQLCRSQKLTMIFLFTGAAFHS